MARFSDILDSKAEDIKRPPLLPSGEYFLMGKKPPEVSETKGRDGTVYERVTFELSVISASEVDEDALAEFGKVAGYIVRKQFLYNTNEDEVDSRKKTELAIKNFLVSCNCFQDGMTLREGLANFPNSQCRGEITHRPDASDPERFYVEVGRTYLA